MVINPDVSTPGFLFLHMAFHINVVHERVRYKFLVEQLPSTDAFDFYKVIGRNKSITFQSNAPVFRRRGLKYRRPDWKVVEGDIWNATFKTAVIAALEAHISKGV